jgi:DNA-directed RNA polymerase specialized sigma24 family protein
VIIFAIGNQLKKIFVMQKINDSELITHVKAEENHAFSLLHKFYFPSISYHIRQNNGSKEDAEDIFQEAIIVLLQKIREADFVLTSSLKTYLFAISKNLWFKRLCDERFVNIEAEDLEIYLPKVEAEIFEIEAQMEKSKEQKVQTWLQKIIRFWGDKWRKRVSIIKFH